MRVSGNGGFQAASAGTVSAVCTRIIDLGTQDTTFKGETKRQRKVLLAWEISEVMDDGRPFLVLQRYTASIHPKSTLGKHLEAWRGRAFTDEERAGFDLAKVLGAACLLTLVKNGEYTNIASISKLMKGMPPLQPVAPLVHLDLDNFSAPVFNGLSENLQATIRKSPEYQAAVGGDGDHGPDADAGVAPGEDDIPF